VNCKEILENCCDFSVGCQLNREMKAASRKGRHPRAAGESSGFQKSGPVAWSGFMNLS
jgi:hypothetical protein